MTTRGTTTGGGGKKRGPNDDDKKKGDANEEEVETGETGHYSHPQDLELERTIGQGEDLKKDKEL